MRLRRLVLASALALFVATGAPLLGSGCVAVAAGAAAAIGFVQYEKNEAFANFEVDYEVAWEESLDALEELGYKVGDVEPGPTEGLIEVDDVRVRVERMTKDTVTVRVRAGTFDTKNNRRRAALILEELHARLS